MDRDQDPVSEHYQKLLGPVYSWMIGDVEAATARADAELEAAGLPLVGAGTAIDLGAGFGMHSLPLARRGYEVIAIDNYQPLLAELRSRAGSLPIRTVIADLLDFKTHVAQPVDVLHERVAGQWHLGSAAILNYGCRRSGWCRH